MDENGYGHTFDASTKRWCLRRVAKAEPPAPAYYPGQKFDPRWLKKVIERPLKDAERGKMGKGRARLELDGDR